MGALRSMWRVSVWLLAWVCVGTSLSPSASAATRIVSVLNGNVFQDSVNGNNISRITMGDTVTWTWGAGTTEPHSTTSGMCDAVSCNFAGDGLWASPIQQTGTFSVTTPFATPGSYPYLCQFHGFPMVGTVIVERPLHHFDVTAPASTTAGSSFSVTITAKDSLNNTITGYTGTVHFASSDPQAVLPANSALVLNTGTATFSVTLKTSGTRSITVNDVASPSITGTTNVTVNPAAASQLVLTAPANASVGSSFLVTVTARDAFTNVATGYTGTVHFTSTDSSALLPTDNTLLSGSRSFNVTMATLGTQNLTVTDTLNGALTDTSTISVATACSIAFSNPAAITINDVGVVPPASPYPSSITVGGLKSMNGLSVTLSGVNHQFGRDMDFLLVAPGGQKMVILSDSGGDNVVSDATIILDDAAAGLAPDVFGAALATGTFKPTNNLDQADTFPAPAPAAPYADPARTGTATFASTFGGINPNGTWSLYATDDQSGGTGSITGGWSLSFKPPPNTACNQASIAIPSVGNSTPYPSSINVSGMDGTVRGVTLRLDKLTQPAVPDLDLLLVGPGGQKMVVMSDVSSGSASNAVVTLDDAGAAMPLTFGSGVFVPSDVTAGDPFSAPAPASPYSEPQPSGAATFASVFGGSNPNGIWSLYVVDDTFVLFLPGGSIASGWTLSFDLIFNTTTAVGADVNPAVWGQTVNFTVNVTSSGPGTPTGTVTLRDGVTVLGSRALSGGSAVFPINTLSVASHNITASYSGDANFNPSNSSIFVETINPAPTTTAVISSLNPSTFGQSVTFTATVSEGAPGFATGTITFRDGLTTIGTGTLNGLGVATFTPVGTALAGGAHSITAVYATNGNFAGSTSPAITQTVNPVATNTGVVSNANPSTFGNSVTFTATVSSAAGPASGSVTFKDGASTLGTGSLNGAGVATFATAALLGGSHNITAVYTTTASFAGSTSPILVQTVNKADPTIDFLALPNPSSFGQSVLFLALLSSGASTQPTGNVTFNDGVTLLSTVPLSSGSAQLNISTLTGGSHNITAVYNGDGNFKTASNGVTQQVNQSGTTIGLSASKPTSLFREAVTFQAVVASLGGGTPSGTVTFFDGATSLGTVTLDGSGRASITVSGLTIGLHAMSVTYSGDVNFNPNASAPMPHNRSPKPH